MKFPENQEGQSIVIKGLATDVLSLRFPHLKEVQRKAKEVGLHIASVEQHNYLSAIKLLEDILEQVDPSQLKYDTLNRIQDVLQEHSQLQI